MSTSGSAVAPGTRGATITATITAAAPAAAPIRRVARTPSAAPSATQTSSRTCRSARIVRNRASRPAAKNAPWASSLRSAPISDANTKTAVAGAAASSGDRSRNAAQSARKTPYQISTEEVTRNPRRGGTGAASSPNTRHASRRSSPRIRTVSPVGITRAESSG